MSRTPTAMVRTLRSGAHNLLPRTTILLYGREAALLNQTLNNLRRQLHGECAVFVLADNPRIQSADLLPATWPRTLPLVHVQPNIPCGKAKLVNLALENVRGDYLLVLEAGDDPDHDLLSNLEYNLSRADDETVGQYGDLELWDNNASPPRHIRTCRGERTASRRRLLARLGKQTWIAPPLLRLDAVKRVGGYPTDYPGEGRLLADTALYLRLLRQGRLNYDPDLSIRRMYHPNRRLRQDESNLLQVLLRLQKKR
ncbi:MAG TPA: glycosyltransferase family 2 protein [Bacilli bacterium]|nr:glycosyltransferase family 2 protein [Bacilli bacterium]